MTMLANRNPEPTGVPPLVHGDRLSLAEFMRRCEHHPEMKKAELIDGVVFLEVTLHPWQARALHRIAFWLGLYVVSRETLLEVLDNVALHLPGGQSVQPDLLMRYLQGASRLAGTTHIDGPPELVIEISATSAAYDLGRKKEIYRAAGVAEYLVWRESENRIDWFVLENGEYQQLPLADGAIESRVFPGLRLPIQAVLNGDFAALLAASTSAGV